MERDLAKAKELSLKPGPDLQLLEAVGSLCLWLYISLRLPLFHD